MKKQTIIGIASAVLISSSAFASATFTDLTGTPGFADFSGSGIDASQSVVTKDTTDGITLGLTATLYHVPTPPNFLPADASTSTFFATPGYSVFNAARATWNFDYFVSGPTVGSFTYELVYQTSPTATPTFFTITPTSGIAQDSSNLAFFAGFNANTTGVYNFTLEALDANKTVVASSTIHVDVENAPEVSSTAWLFALSLGGLGICSRMRRQAVV
jgi:hypothetical protein